MVETRRCISFFWLVFLMATGSCKASMEPKFTSHRTDDEKDLLLFPGTARSEGELPYCEPRSVCGIVHRRYWFPNQLKRMCRCPGADAACPKTWADPPDNFTMPLDSRSQLKFCESTSDLPSCWTNQGVLNVKYDKNNNKFRIETSINCTCPVHSVWTLKEHYYKEENDTVAMQHNSYTCTPVQPCKLEEPCGYIRVDYFSTYYRCSCPNDHICIHQDKRNQTESQLFFRGPVYLSNCVPFPGWQNQTATAVASS